MKPFKYWSIRNKLILSLFAVMVLGGGGITWALMAMQDEILNEALPEERALDGIRRTSLELLSEYHEFIVAPSDFIHREINELKEEMAEYASAFGRFAESEISGAQFVEAIKASTQNLMQVGDETIATRVRLMDHIQALEVFEAETENLPASRPVDIEVGDAASRAEPMETGDVLELGELLAQYLSELREYTLVPSNQTREEIAEIERSLELISRAGAADPAFKLDHQAGNTAERLLIQRIREAGNITTALANEFQSKHRELERREDDLLSVLDEAGFVVARRTDRAFETGFTAVVVITTAVLALIFLVSYLVSQRIARAVSILADTANRLGRGDFSVRAKVGGNDEIGDLAATFNKMAVSLELSIKQGERIAELEEAHYKLEIQGKSLASLADDLRIARDEARAANRAKSEFLAAMSHELRTPLNAVIGFSEVISNETFGPVGNEKYREYSIDISESGKHLLGLINDILDLTKIESGKDIVHENRVDVPEIIRSSLRLVKQRAEEQRIELELDLPDQLPALRADKRKLKQILVNLLSNAIKFTDGGGKVTLKAWCQTGRGHVFQIVDTGVGIAPEDISKALSRFGQVDGDLNRKYDGTGLGVPLTKALVEQHGGVFDLQSEVGVGTTVTVRFPAERIVASPDIADSLGVPHRVAS